MTMTRITARMGRIAALVSVALLGAAPFAAAQQADSAAAAVAPTLDYTFTWPTFLLCVALVVGYYIFLFRGSEKEFQGVINERFGPAHTSRGGSHP